MTRILLIIISLTILPGLAYAKGKESSLERAMVDEILDNGGDEPGQHGRDNAARKQAANPGKGSDNHTSLEGTILDEVLDDDDDKGDKGKGKGKKGK